MSEEEKRIKVEFKNEEFEKLSRCLQEKRWEVKNIEVKMYDILFDAIKQGEFIDEGGITRHGEIGAIISYIANGYWTEGYWYEEMK